MMVPKIHPRGVIWVQSNRPQAGNLAVQFKDVYAHVYKFLHRTYFNDLVIVPMHFQCSLSFFSEFVSDTILLWPSRSEAKYLVMGFRTT